MNFDVFLSFRGEDTRLGFIGQLYNALVRRGIRTFIDDTLLRGEQISAQLLKTIESSTISIGVWMNLPRLLSVRRMISWCGRFYNVDPSEVRNQKGKFGEALAEHEKVKDNNKVQRWREALTEAGNLSGWHY